MKVKVSELEGAALDWAVCRAQHPDADMSATHVWLDSFDGEDDFLIDKTSTDWSQGGPIIDRQEISLHPTPKFAAQCMKWGASQRNINGACVRSQFGPTPLIAAMRCYVASKLGEEVEVPSSLL